MLFVARSLNKGIFSLFLTSPFSAIKKKYISKHRECGTLCVTFPYFVFKALWKIGVSKINRAKSEETNKQNSGC